MQKHMSKFKGVLCPDSRQHIAVQHGNVILCFLCGTAWVAQPPHQELDYGDAIDDLSDDDRQLFYRLGISAHSTLEQRG